MPLQSLSLLNSTSSSSRAEHLAARLAGGAVRADGSRSAFGGILADARVDRPTQRTDSRQSRELCGRRRRGQRTQKEKLDARARLARISARCCWRATRFCMWSESANMKPHDPNSPDMQPLSRRLPRRICRSVSAGCALARSARARRMPPGRRLRGQAAKPRQAVICLFQHGGPSQMDLFDPKPS